MSAKYENSPIKRFFGGPGIVIFTLFLVAIIVIEILKRTGIISSSWPLLVVAVWGMILALAFRAWREARGKNKEGQ